MTRQLVALALAALGLATISACSVHVDNGDNVSRQVGTDAFRVGGHVNLTDPVQGDAFLAGGQVSTANEVGSDLIIAAGEVSVGGSVGDDLYAAGGNVKVDAIVHGSARVGGGDVTFGPATVVAGSTRITGGRIDFQGNSHGPLTMTGGSVAMSGQAHGDVEVRAEELTVLPGTQVAGRLIYHGPTPPDVPEGVLIAGGTFFLGTDSAPHARHTKETSCGCAGIYSAHAGIELYAEAFEQAGRLERLEAFASERGADFYGRPRNADFIEIVREPWTVPASYPFGGDEVVPLRAGGEVAWRLTTH